IHSNRVISEILSLENVDGSFGKAGYSKIASTYYSLSTLSMLGYDLNRFGNTLNWIRRCEVPSGGFVGSTESSSTYIVMEDIYFGLKTLEILHENCRYPNETLTVIAKFQNPNGGFRRSIFLGISDFESTYQALSCIKTILQQHQEKREYGMNLEGDGVRLRS
ncbi:MAG: prenyltransferase/squalene oxidase repeat-containing protein, partial [Candidatus Bathyarchaeia archaeon]